MGNRDENMVLSFGSSLLELANSELAMSLLICASLFPPCRSWLLLSWHTPCSGPLASSSFQLSLAAMSPALTPSFLSTVPTSRLPEILPGMVKGLRCCPRRLGSYQDAPEGPLWGTSLAFDNPICPVMNYTAVCLGWYEKHGWMTLGWILLLGLKMLSGAWGRKSDMRPREIAGLRKVLR